MKLYPTLSTIAFSSLRALVIYGAFAILIGIVVPKNAFNIISFIIMCISYPVGFYRTYSQRAEKSMKAVTTYANHENGYKPFDEVKAFFKSKDGKYYFWTLVVMSVLCEISFFIANNSKKNLIGFLCLFVFPFMDVVEIPIVRACVCLPIALIELGVLIAILGKKIHKNKF